MATYLQLVNSVLRRLREDEVASVSATEYSVLIGDFVNEAKREVEDAWRWIALRSSVSINTVDGTSEYSITGAGKRYRFQAPGPSVYNRTKLFWMNPGNRADLQAKVRSASDLGTKGVPDSYFMQGFDSNGDPKITVHPKPDAVYTIDLSLVIPQNDFTTEDDVLSVPDYPVILGAYSRALAERGEDQGRTHGEVMQTYQSALWDSIALDEASTIDETTWYV